jgi:hypothetical protein
MSQHAAGPAEGEVEVTPSDTVTFDACRGLYIETGGTIKYQTRRGDIITKSVADFSHHPVRVVRVYQTDTTATGIFLQY